MKSWLALTHLFLLLFLISFIASAQDENSEYDENYEFKESKSVAINIGLGLGLDYGGIGGKLMVVPSPHLGIFGAIGYNLNGAGYNGGVIYRFLPDAKACPYASVMYGYNGVIVVEGLDEATKTYYGPSIEGGIELHKRDKPNFWNFALIVPLRSKEYYDDIDALQKDPRIEQFSEPLPFSISVGFHFGI